MPKLTRGQFLKWAALSGALGADILPKMEAQTSQPASSRNADVIVINAHVLTSDPALPQVEAFAVKNGRFLAVGSSADMRKPFGTPDADDRRRWDDGYSRVC